MEQAEGGGGGKEEEKEGTGGLVWRGEFFTISFY